MPSPTVEGEVGENLADDRAELEAVAGEAGSEEPRWGVRVTIDEEVLVRRRLEGQVASASVEPAPSGKYRCANALSGSSSSSVGSRGDRVGVAAGSEVVVAADLEPRDAEDRKAVEMLAVEYDVEHGKPFRREQLRSQGLEPRDHLAKCTRQPRWQAGDVLGPGAGGEHEAVGVDDPSIGANAHAVLGLGPLHHALAGSDDGTARERPVDVRHDAPLGEEETAVRLEEDRQISGEAKCRIARTELTAVDCLVPEAVVGARADAPS